MRACEKVFRKVSELAWLIVKTMLCIVRCLTSRYSFDHAWQKDMLLTSTGLQRSLDNIDVLLRIGSVRKDDKVAEGSEIWVYEENS